MKLLMKKQRLAGIAMALALLASLGLASASGLAVVDQEMLVNGNFEGGFTMVPGCGMVGAGWGCFTNGGTADYGFYDDQWAPVVADGLHSQLIEINTMQYAASESDRYAGVYQTVHLVPGQQYEFRLFAGMRERSPDPLEDPYRYRVQWGYTLGGSTDWQQVSNWVELPFDKIDERTAPTGLEMHSTKFVAPCGTITLFVRAWKKWGTAYKELDVNLDSLSVWGPAVRHPVEPAGPVAFLPGPVTDAWAEDGGLDHGWVDDGKADAAPLSCGGRNLIVNGSFESGFSMIPGCGVVGSGWGCFTNGGSAEYGFYDDMWPPVVKDGAHSQLIEINTKQFAASDADRRAGIYQVVRGLRPGATYEFSLWGQMREEASHPDEDPYRYRVEWGYAPLDCNPSPADIINWVEIPWDTIYPRIEPGDMAFHAVNLQAPSSKVIIGIRAWKKWGTSYRELDVNLDAVSLVRCAPKPPHCTHVVAPGDSLMKIARGYDTTIAGIVEPNNLGNPNELFVGQELAVPCLTKWPDPVQPPKLAEPPMRPEAPVGCAVQHVVVRGDTLHALAREYGASVEAMVDLNQIANPNLIYVGQTLCINPQ
jgi:LysM repeat protein